MSADPRRDFFDVVHRRVLPENSCLHYLLPEKMIRTIQNNFYTILFVLFVSLSIML